MRRMRDIAVGEHQDFPVRHARTIQNYRTLLNAMNYRDGHHWEAVIIKEEGVIRARRLA